MRHRGLRLMLDFVPNHTAPDHPWVSDHTEFCVAGTAADLANAPHNYTRLQRARGDVVLALGRDPYVAGWPDTLQLDYSNPVTQEAMVCELLRIARQCDGVRCDMAMLVLPEVFERIWGRRAPLFWPDAIRRVREQVPGFCFMAEVYHRAASPFPGCYNAVTAVMHNRRMPPDTARDVAAQIDDVLEGRSATRAPGTRFLHVANGTSTTMTIEGAGIPGARSIWADPLYEGPVPAGLTDPELVDVRTQYLAAGAADLTGSAWAASNPALDPINDLREWRAAIERDHAYDELILWFEHDLFDQLNLVQLLAWVRDHLPAAKPVSLICLGSFPGHPDFKGLGELSPDELASLLETRQRITDRQYELARQAWQAFREPTPEALDGLRQADTSPLPYLAPAITRFLQEYPWTTDGLSRSERRLLELADGDGIPLWKAFPLMDDGERAYHMTGESLAGLAAILSRTSPALLTLTTSATPEGHDLRDIATLTDAGRSILSGRQDRIAVCGIDRWLGGVHLQHTGRVWRWDDTRQRIC